jgi:hypothetical protein
MLRFPKVLCFGAHCVALLRNDTPTAAPPAGALQYLCNESPPAAAPPAGVLPYLVALLAVAFAAWLFMDRERCLIECNQLTTRIVELKTEASQTKLEGHDREMKLQLLLQEACGRETRLVSALQDVAALQEDRGELLDREAERERQPTGLLSVFQLPTTARAQARWPRKSSSSTQASIAKPRPHAHLSDCSADQLSDIIAPSPHFSYAGSERGSEYGSETSSRSRCVSSTPSMIGLRIGRGGSSFVPISDPVLESPAQPPQEDDDFKLRSDSKVASETGSPV